MRKRGLSLFMPPKTLGGGGDTQYMPPMTLGGGGDNPVYASLVPW